MERIKQFEEYLKQSGLKVTKQRSTIVKEFIEAERHCTTDELHHAMRGHSNRVGYATVHRTLKLLVASGLACELYFGDGQTRYEMNRYNQHHDHMVCLCCGKVIEFEEPQIELLQKNIAKIHNFHMQTHRLELYGICSLCHGCLAVEE